MDVKKEIKKSRISIETFGNKNSKEIISTFEKYKDQIARALPEGLKIKPEYIIQQAVTLIVQDPDLKNCTTKSILGGIITGTLLGLNFIPTLGQAYLVPFNNEKKGVREAQFIIGYRGLVQLMRKSKEIKDAVAYPIFKDDHIEIIKGTEPAIRHVPNLNATRDETTLIGFYSVIRTVNGGILIDEMTVDEVKKIMLRSKSAQSKYSPWFTDFIEMGRKTVLKRNSKYAPLRTYDVALIETDESVIDIDHIEGSKIDIGKIEKVQLESEPIIEDVENEVVEEKPNKEPYLFSETQSSGKTKAPRDFNFLNTMANYKRVLGEKIYYKLLNECGYLKSTHVIDREEKQRVLKAFQDFAKEKGIVI